MRTSSFLSDPTCPLIFADRSVDALAVLARLKSGVTKDPGRSRDQHDSTGARPPVSRCQPQHRCHGEFADAGSPRRCQGNDRVAIWSCQLGAFDRMRQSRQPAAGALHCQGPVNLVFGRRFAPSASAWCGSCSPNASCCPSRVAHWASFSRPSDCALLLAALPHSLPRAENIGLHIPVLSVHNRSFDRCRDSLWAGSCAAMRKHRCAEVPLQSSARGTTSARHRLLGRLVVVQFALTLVLMTGAGLLLRSVRNLWHVNPGFNMRHVISFHVGLSPSLTDTPDRTRTAYQQLLARID